ncbi:hypothetical protein J2W91_004729 [Paenibacillus amylolyticus]|uniref:Uncharacterized protein n=1 Tax=Paenibacillus amylolyticus TaxID=1451 RepID=A0AAP5H7K4_PAEAM|nr:hypothetical protein [Paenibacillus amylolyticus]MDR6726223.1 hypothetical protein [Paenibacillus amylolyticus]
MTLNSDSTWAAKADNENMPNSTGLLNDLGSYITIRITSGL